jgi:hypothetical protein
MLRGSPRSDLAARPHVPAGREPQIALRRASDLVSERFDLRMAVADVLYSSPYASFADKESQGGASCSSNLRPTMSLPPSIA